MSDSKNNKLDETFKNENDNLIEQFETVVNNLNAFKSQITSIQQQIKNIEKNVKKRLKTLKNEKIKNGQKIITSLSLQSSKSVTHYVRGLKLKLTRGPHEALKRSRGPQFGRDKALRAAIK